MEKLKIEYPILVEGKYDKIKLESIVDALIITSEGFRIFKSDEKKRLLQKLSQKSKIIVLSDSDSAGMLIRSCVKGIIPGDRIVNLYTPQLEGKERRKTKPSKEGFVGVEGVDAALLKELLSPFCTQEREVHGRKITKADLYRLGLSGREGSSERRERICRSLDLPATLTANALLDALNLFYSYEQIENMCNECL